MIKDREWGMPRTIRSLQLFGYTWNTVAGIVWAVELARNGYLMIFRPIPDLILAAQRLYLPWESLWQPLDELFGVAIVGATIGVLFFAPGFGALIVATWLEDHAQAAKTPPAPAQGERPEA